MPTFIMKAELCKARCFPPVALVWDPPYGLEVYPNLTSQVIVVDSSPATWGSAYGSEHTTILLLVCLGALSPYIDSDRVHRSLFLF